MKKILIVDDSATARMFVKRCLEIAGFKDAVFVEVGDGLDALEKMRENQFDIVFSDLTMPNMDGVTLLKNIKTDPRLQSAAVFIISSAGNPAMEKTLLNEGALAVLKKPVSPSVLVPVAEYFMNKK